MTRFYCPQILLSDGWAENQLLEVDGLGSITGIRNGSMNEAQHQLQGPVVPGMPNLHSHAFQRGMAGCPSRVPGRRIPSGAGVKGCTISSRCFLRRMWKRSPPSFTWKC